MIFSLIGLLIVVAIVGFLAKSQLSAVTQLPNPTSVNSNAISALANIAEQNKQLQTQVKEQLNAAMDAAQATRVKLETDGSK